MTLAIILNYNSRPFLKNCLDSLINQIVKPDKILVVDNASIDDSVKFLEKFYPQITLVKNKSNLGVGKAFNQAIKKFSPDYKYVALFNPDIKLDKNWLKESIKILADHPEAEVAASSNPGRILNIFAGLFVGATSLKNAQPVFFGVITAMLIRAGAFKKYGYFDEDYFMYFEDIDFCWRVLLGGGKILYAAKAKLWHFGHGSKPNPKLQLKIHSGAETNLLATYYKNLSVPFLISLLPILIIARSLGSLVYLKTDPALTLAKLKAIVLFILRVLKGSYNRKGFLAQKIRKIGDREILNLWKD
ncbi:glycosyltransferase family 2 protein [Candidatus Gottesmanbacteria bacterium]|nr:glycosyltransferase family 2 protein [Candidatus Gottesmanbacteria bacterium]